MRKLSNKIEARDRFITEILDDKKYTIDSVKKYKASHPACGLTPVTTIQIDLYTNLV